MKEKYENELIFYKKNKNDKKLMVINDNNISKVLPNNLKIKNYQNKDIIKYNNLKRYTNIIKIETNEPILNELGQIKLTIKWIKNEEKHIISGYSYLGIYTKENFDRMLKEALYSAFSKMGGYPDIWYPLNIKFIYLIKK